MSGPQELQRTSQSRGLSDLISYWFPTYGVCSLKNSQELMHPLTTEVSDKKQLSYCPLLPFMLQFKKGQKTVFQL